MSDKVKHGLNLLYTVISGGMFAFYAIAWLTNPAPVLQHGANAATLFAKFAAAGI